MIINWIFSDILKPTSLLQIFNTEAYRVLSWQNITDVVVLQALLNIRMSDGNLTLRKLILISILLSKMVSKAEFNILTFFGGGEGETQIFIGTTVLKYP